MKWCDNTLFAKRGEKPNHRKEISMWLQLFTSPFLNIFSGLSFVVQLTRGSNVSITDFYVESSIDGMHNGVFRSDTPVNWHRKHKAHHASYNGDRVQSRDDFSNRKIFTNHLDANTTVGQKTIRVDESGIEIPNSGERASANGTSFTKRSKRLKMSNHIGDHCTQGFWSENVAGSRTQLTKRWSYNKADLKNKTVSFR